jgi:hypothetical protein
MIVHLVHILRLWTINIKGESYRLKEKKRAGPQAKAAAQGNDKQALKA